MLVRFNKRTIVGGTTYEKDAEQDLANDLAEQVVRQGNGAIIGLGKALPACVGKLLIGISAPLKMDTAAPGGGIYIPFNLSTYDDLRAHSTTENNTRITIPDGVTRARFVFKLDTQAAPSAAEVLVELRKNGVASPIVAQVGQHMFASGEYGVYTCHIPELRGLVAGDYFEFWVRTTATVNFHNLAANDPYTSGLYAEFFG